MEALDNRIGDYLEQRKEDHLFRQLSVPTDAIDFSSNDYLGLSRSAFIAQQVEQELHQFKNYSSGATGSRLLNGNSVLCEEVEALVAKTHHAEAALLFNSGFDANVGLISTVARPGDIIFYDELVHASIHQGMKLSGATLITFRHNDLSDLEDKLRSSDLKQIRFIITESIFSMEGDRPDLKELSALATRYSAELILDEAHATGIYGVNGSGLCNVAGIEKACFARVYTFGKAVGSHGGAVVGSRKLKEYLVNFSKNFIYTTALETHNLLRVKHAYIYLQGDINQSFRLKNRMEYFKNHSQHLHRYKIGGDGPVFSIIVPGNQPCRELALHLQEHGIDVKAILSPTVPKGRERVRIILHSFNTTGEIDQFIHLISTFNK